MVTFDYPVNGLEEVTNNVAHIQVDNSLQSSLSDVVTHYTESESDYVIYPQDSKINLLPWR